MPRISLEVESNREGLCRLPEPSAGDGAFVRGLAKCIAQRQIADGYLICVELAETERNRCRQEMSRLVHGSVIHDSFFQWMGRDKCLLDAVVGNPPFLRYQFVPPCDHLLAEWLLRARGRELDGVSNAWIPSCCCAIDLLEARQRISMVLPSELLSTVSAGRVRKALVRHLDDLQIELFPRDVFPDILRDVSSSADEVS